MDLMSGNEHYEYRELARKYGNFLQPAFQIFVEGTEVARSGKVPVRDVNVTLSCGETNACRMTIPAPYDLEKSTFGPKQMDLLALGKKVSVKLGYGSALMEVFRGYISEVEVEYSATPQLVVTMMDLRKLMMSSRRMRQMTVKAPSDAVSKVMESYRKLYDHLSIQADKAEAEPFQLKQHRESDYDFVMRMCEVVGKEFFLLGGDVYYQSRDRYPNPVITLAPQGGGIQSFSSQIRYEVKRFLAIGREPNSKKEIYRSRIYRSEFVKKTLLPSPPPTVHASPSIQTVADAEKWLDDAVRKEKEKGISATVRCLGLPELGPGHYMECSKLGAPFDRKYFIESVTHSIGSDGFTTELSLSG